MNGNQPMWTLLYDGECPLCRMLAGLMSGPVMAWQDAVSDIAVADFTQDPPVIVTGPAAWEILVAQEPALQRWQWLAGKLGLSPQAAAATLRHSAHFARRICPRCGPRSPLVQRPEQEIRHNLHLHQGKEET